MLRKKKYTNAELRQNAINELRKQELRYIIELKENNQTISEYISKRISKNNQTISKNNQTISKNNQTISKKNTYF